MIDPEGEIYIHYGNGSVPYHVLIDRDFRTTLSEEDFEKDRLIRFYSGCFGGTRTEVNEGIIFGREEKLHMKRAFLRVLQKVLSKMSYEGD